MNTHPTAGATEERQDDVRRAAGGSRRSPDNEARSQSVLTRVNTEEITIRPEALKPRQPIFPTSSAEYVASLSHYYRAELSRMMSWRDRLDHMAGGRSDLCPAVLQESNQIGAKNEKKLADDEDSKQHGSATRRCFHAQNP